MPGFQTALSSLLLIVEEEELANVRDSVTSRLPSQEQNVGRGASGFGGLPMWSRIGQAEVYTQKSGEDAEEEQKMAPVATKTRRKREVANGFHGGIFLAVQGTLYPNGRICIASG